MPDANRRNLDGSLGVDGDVGDASGSEDAAVALDFGGRAHCLGIVVRELYGRAAVDFAEFADEADGVEAVVAAGIAVAKIVGEVGAPAGAETDAVGGGPLAFVKKVGGAAEVGSGGAVADCAGEVGVKREDAVDVERVRGDKALLARVASVLLQPCDVFVAGNERILAVDALAGPVGDPVGGVVAGTGWCRMCRAA